MLYLVIDENYFGGNFGIFDNIEEAENHKMKLLNDGYNVFIVLVNKIPFIRDEDDKPENYV